MMHFLVCLAGLPQEAVERVRAKSPFDITGGPDNKPIVRGMASPYVYRSDMVGYFHSELARRIEALDPTSDIGVVLAYVNYPDSAPSFVAQFFPFALAAPLDPISLEGLRTEARKIALSRFVDQLITTVSDSRSRIVHLREALTGQKLSPFNLPMRNFNSKEVLPMLKEVYRELGVARSRNDADTMLRKHRQSIVNKYPVVRPKGKLSYIADDSGFHFRSPGSDYHGYNRAVTKDHNDLCLINSRVRLGSPIPTGFHYDCSFGEAGVRSSHPNCHDVIVPMKKKRKYVNIAPNDAIR